MKLSWAALEALTNHLTRQLEEIDRAGDAWRENGLAFATVIGTPLSRHNLTRRSFGPLLAKAGLPRVRFHDLRHTCATILLSKGVHAKFVQELLGHATIAITLDTYSHVLPGMGGQTAEAWTKRSREPQLGNSSMPKFRASPRRSSSTRSSPCDSMLS